VERSQPSPVGSEADGSEVVGAGLLDDDEETAFSHPVDPAIQNAGRNRFTHSPYDIAFNVAS
jgi:hypothetical protein